MRPASPPAWTSLAASSSMCTRLMRQRSFSSPTQYSNQPSDGQRLVVLADLVRLGQVGIEVVLAVEDVARLHGAVERQGDARGVLDGAPVDHRQRAGVRQAHRAGVRVGLVALGDGAAAEHLGLRVELDVDLEADHRLPGASCSPRCAPCRAVGARPAAASRRPARAESRKVGAVSKPIAPSSACAASRMRFSLNAGPMSWKPTGRPSLRPQGMLTRRQAGQVDRDGADVAHVHRQRVGGARAGLEGDRRRGGRGDQVDVGEGRGEVAAHQRAHLLGAAVVGVVVAGRERVGADHDAPLDLGAEALAARALVHVEQVGRVGAAVAVAHAVEARQVRARLGRRDDVVRRQRVLGVRQADLDARAAQLLDARDASRRSARARRARCRRPGTRPGTPTRRPSSRSAVGQRDRLGQLDAGRVVAGRGRRCAAAAARSRTTERVSGPIWSSELAKAMSP